ncbi:MAG: hypothetical protein QS748_07060 [Candidatus Endonucleobacter bathymodioli]|uniref:Transposase DDE domain-containing protein n=1 Tax=Candidatus Endonucleibacter bathymodioli TaxID=539814 RepID=A0AA90NR10_9GAMM|nr:hypothetical protein [Candidatus Endonucleobacter bathymodioli]
MHTGIDENGFFQSQRVTPAIFTIIRNATPCKEIPITRLGNKHPFSTHKRYYGLTRTRLMGLAKKETSYGLTAIAANIRKSTKFLVFMVCRNYACRIDAKNQS